MQLNYLTQKNLQLNLDASVINEEVKTKNIHSWYLNS